ncbi:MAG: DNA-binding protein [Terrimesophilobacter sp.]
MFVITADQVESRSHADLVATTIESLNNGTVATVLEADRTAGDELQVLIASPLDALAVVLQLTRSGQWSVGCGVGNVVAPLPKNIRAATGEAFIAARRAVERAKKRPTRFALETEPAAQAAADAESLTDLLVALRARRSPEGWELYDLLERHEVTQTEAAVMLGISPQAVSLRARAAELRTEQAARPSLARILRQLDSVDSTATERRL